MLSRVTKNVFHFLSYLHVDSKNVFHFISYLQVDSTGENTQFKGNLNTNYPSMFKFFSLMSFKDVISDIILA
jgi:hypothetical protein